VTAEAGTLERLVRMVGGALSAIADRLDVAGAAELISELGLVPPYSILESPGAGAALSSAAAAAGDLKTGLASLTSAIEAADASSPASIISLVDEGRQTLSRISSLIAKLEALATALRTGAQALPAAERAIVEDFLKDFASRLVDYLLLQYVDRFHDRLVAMIALTGIVEDRLVGDPYGDPALIPHRHRRIHLDALAKVAKDPSAYLADTTGWGTPGFDGYEIIDRIINALDIHDERLSLIQPPGEDLTVVLPFGRISAAPDPVDPSAPRGLVATLTGLSAKSDGDVSLGGPWSILRHLESSWEPGVSVGLFPPGRVTLKPLLGKADAHVRFGLRAQRSDGGVMAPIVLAGATRIEVKRFELTAEVEAHASGPAAAVAVEPRLSLAAEGLSLVLDAGQGDSFLKSISGGGRGRSDISLGATWSPAAGLKFEGSAALEIAIPAHARLGPATLETVYLIGSFDGDEVSLELSAALRGTLGPFTAVVDRVGALFTASFPDGGGNLGPVQFDVGFKPPSGLGLAIDAGGFSGGGFLRRDPDNGEYGGALELSFHDVIDVKAFGVLNTKLPDGSDAFSLAVVISAEFAPIQLSFGFTLLGVGGLIGVNRTALYDQLRLSLRDGSMNSILFPTNLVANAPRIINDLKRLFPPEKGRFLIGPMAKLGWGTPSIITLDIGLLLEIPRPGFAILGILRLVLPAKEAAILNLQVNFLGVVDFERKEISFDASLFDSRLLAFTLTGDMALRIYWGENANFLLTVGGFHPDYVPPPLALPSLNRLAISMWAGNPRLSAEAYFAVTSNTVQFGAKVELYYGVKIFNVYGFISLDALIQFEPFHLIAKVAGQVAVRSGGSTLFSIKLEMTLEGPSPWHAHGSGSFEIGFVFTVTISAGFDITFGERRNTSLPPVQLRTLLEDALRNEGAWRVIAAGRQHVATRDLTASPELVVSPIGSLAVAQKVAPLNLALARVGARRVDGANRFQIVDVSLGASSDPPATNVAFEQFAAAQYLDLSDAERLSRRSFEPLEAGVEIAGGNAPRADAQTKVDVAYEVIYVRKPRRRRLLFTLRDALLDMLLQGSAAARSKVSQTRKLPTGIGTPEVTLPAEQFTVAGVSDLAPLATGFSSQTAAHAALEVAVANDPSLAGKLQVVSSFELAA